MKLPNQYVKPSTYRTAITDSHNGSIQFNTSGVRSETQAATDVSAYVQALSEALDDYLNGPEWRQAAIEKTPCEFRPAGSEATGQQVITMADRSVTFDPRKNWDNQTVVKGDVLAGSIIFTEPTDSALMISYRTTILDHNLMAGFTVGSMHQTGEKMLEDIEYAAAGKIAAMLTKAKSTEVKYETMPTGKPADVADGLIDLLTTYVNQTVGTSLRNFLILLPASMLSTLELAATRAGYGPDAESLLGTGIQPYAGTDQGIFMLPKSFTSLSYRERGNGDIWRVVVTRNGARQGWDLEIMATVDVVANGKVKVKLTADGLQTETVAFPMITRIYFGAPPTVAVTGVSLKTASKDLAVGASYSNTVTITPTNATNQNVTWATSDASVATVSAAGSVKGIKVGKATITCTTVDGGFSASFTVNVTAA
ncbi:MULTISPECIES: Ig-like domain-containing protein [Pseudomonas]|uniref:Ig domain-containing protein n=1 Tax=Pseudomonas quercus TaxID=2722792 RepID=A0ABX0YF67_9PSED|nr:MULTISPECIES: Ig-like domain-containing protein [Pseudomonas]MBF7143868.1 Ig domain-containing protein [Pseudomonas sp. LY10J]NJP02053.1 Ig domain-containing protein [Pseudomonas quercus]